MSDVNGNKELSRGELRSQWRDRHLCLKCSHHAVCKMSDALDPNLLVVVSQCMASAPVDHSPEEDES